MDKNLTKDFEFYKKNQAQLLQEHEGKFVVIKNEIVVGSYQTELEAYTEAKDKYELGTFLIQECVPGTDAYTQTFHSRVLAH